MNTPTPGKMMVELRRINRWSLEQAAVAFGKDVITIARWEAELTRPRGRALSMLNRLFYKAASQRKAIR